MNQPRVNDSIIGRIEPLIHEGFRDTVYLTFPYQKYENLDMREQGRLFLAYLISQHIIFHKNAEIVVLNDPEDIIDIVLKCLRYLGVKDVVQTHDVDLADLIWQLIIFARTKYEIE